MTCRVTVSFLMYNPRARKNSEPKIRHKNMNQKLIAHLKTLRPRVHQNPLAHNETKSQPR
jgi:hypothetical protein